MDKHLRPSRFDAELTSPNIEKEWKHWFRTFENFIANLTFPNAEADAVQASKLQMLTNFLSASVYEYVAEETTYDGAINVLKALYVKPKNVIYNRHKVATRTQSEGENVDQFMQNLEQLSKHCEFTAVTAEQYRKEYIRDAFINGLSSNHIRQRLLENNNLTLEDAYQKARTLELAQKQSASYSSSSPSVVAVVTPEEDTAAPVFNPDTLAASQFANQRKTPRNNRQEPNSSSCYFCGEGVHPREQYLQICVDSICRYCKTKGHWDTVCQKRIRDMNLPKRSGKLSAMAQQNSSPTLCATSGTKRRCRRQ